MGCDLLQHEHKRKRHARSSYETVTTFFLNTFYCIVLLQTFCFCTACPRTILHRRWSWRNKAVLLNPGSTGRAQIISINITVLVSTYRERDQQIQIYLTTQASPPKPWSLISQLDRCVWILAEGYNPIDWAVFFGCYYTRLGSVSLTHCCDSEEKGVGELPLRMSWISVPLETNECAWVVFSIMFRS